MHNRIRTFGLLLLVIPALAYAQGRPKAQSCFFSANFEDGLIPAGWDIGALVERQTPAGDSLGEFVPAWSVGTASAANANGYFPVVDLPIGNHFAMANDDASPCNCTMADVTLTTSPIDLTGRANVALECRVFNEMILGSDTAVIEASTDGSTFWPLLEIPAVADAWQDILVDLSDYDGQPGLQLRFRWSDGGGWSSGFALDDICLRERSANDLSVVAVATNTVGFDPFQTGDQTLRYRLLPLEQAGPLTPSVRVLNRGMNDATAVTISVTITLNGSEVYSSSGIPVGDMPAGEPAIVFTVSTGWVPTGVGETVVSITVASAVDDDHTDNTGTATMRITGPGWDNVYGAMACDEGQMQGTVGGTNNFIAMNRMEIVNEGSTAQGISAVIASNSQAGELVRAILFDANFAFIDSSLRHTITEEDLFNGWLGEALYLPLSTAPTLAAGDYHVGMQRLTGTGEVFIATSGNSPLGAAVLMQGTTFDITYLTATPMVRLHVDDYGVGMDEQQVPHSMRTYPVPANDLLTVEFALTASSQARLEVLDVMGRVVLQQDLGRLPAGTNTHRFGVGDLAVGSYVLRLVADNVPLEQLLVIAR